MWTSDVGAVSRPMVRTLPPAIPRAVVYGAVGFIAVTAMVKVCFNEIEGQTPNPEQDGELSKWPAGFRGIKGKALGNATRASS